MIEPTASSARLIGMENFITKLRGILVRDSETLDAQERRRIANQIVSTLLMAGIACELVPGEGWDQDC